MSRKISLLIIEDEADIRSMLHFSLPSDDFSLLEAEDTSIAIKKLADYIPDLILLDWMLPGKSGIEFIKWIKQQENLKDIPIIMLTAKAEEENRVKGLMTGADDYIIKPFSPMELIARIKTVLRRGPIVSPENEIKHNGIVINIEKQQVKIEGHIIKLSPIEYKMLCFFMKNPNKTFTRDRLMSHVWGNNVYIDDRTVDVQIRRLRDKLKEHNQHHLIKTIRGSGYQFSKDDE